MCAHHCAPLEYTAVTFSPLDDGEGAFTHVPCLATRLWRAGVTGPSFRRAEFSSTHICKFILQTMYMFKLANDVSHIT